MPEIFLPNQMHTFHQCGTVAVPGIVYAGKILNPFQNFYSQKRIFIYILQDKFPDVGYIALQMVALIIGASIVLQYTAALLALRLVYITGKWKAWSLIAFALILMGVRRSITLYRLLSGDNSLPPDTMAELVALMISALMVAGVILIAPFFSKLQKTNKALDLSEALFRGAFDQSIIPMALIGLDGSLLKVNEALINLFGYSEQELLELGWRTLIHPDELQEANRRFNRVTCGELEDYTAETRYINKNGDVLWIAITISSVRGEEYSPGYFIAVLQDITRAKWLSHELDHQARHDALTGLLNRHEFERRLDRILAGLKHNHSEHALCFLDLDQFKVVNDTCGHHVGDELLKQLGMTLQKGIRKRDTLARLGGDEFGILMEHCPLDQAHRVANALRQSVEDFNFPWEGKSFRVGVSIGLVPITEEVTNVAELLQHADAACYMAKDQGRNRIHVYHTEDTELARRHGEMQWVTRINQALEENRFRLYAQPIASLDNETENDICYELLLRMIDENGKVIMPRAFLPAAERYNLVTKLDRWVFETALTILKAHPDFLAQLSFCSFNISGQSFDEIDFLEFIVDQILEKNIDSKKICFEITETAMISNLETASRFISTLRVQGCSFALDDFGSGLSSFGYLKSLPVNYLKIDGMFVKNIVDDPIDNAMVKSINEVGQVMGMRTIAEFVENSEIKGMLREIGVDYAQGYGIGRPGPLLDIINTFHLKLAQLK